MMCKVRDRTKIPVLKSKNTCLLYVCHGVVKRYGAGFYGTCIRTYTTVRGGCLIISKCRRMVGSHLGLVSRNCTGLNKVISSED